MQVSLWVNYIQLPARSPLTIPLRLSLNLLYFINKVWFLCMLCRRLFHNKIPNLPLMRNQNQIKVEIIKEMKDTTNFLLKIFQTVGMYLSLKVFFLNLEKLVMLASLIMKISQDLLL